MAEELVGKNLGPYELLGLLGRGPISAVYRAYHASANRTVAIKVLPGELLRDADFFPQFEEEVRAIAQLQHFHILPVYEASQADGRPFIVMRFMTVGTLGNLLARYGRLSVAETVPIMQQVAAALDHAHQRGIVHRYLKPSNILLDDQGNAYVSDFGIARVHEALNKMTDSGVLGGMSYVSPEVINGARTLTPSVDVYALGVMVFEMLTGYPPFRGSNAAETAKMHLTAPPPSPRDINQDVPQPVAETVMYALAKNPADRYKSAGEFAKRLSTAAGITTNAVRQGALPADEGTGEFRHVPPKPSMAPITPPPGSIPRVTKEQVEADTPLPSFSQGTPPPRQQTPPLGSLTPPMGTPFPHVQREMMTPIPGATPITTTGMTPPPPSYTPPLGAYTPAPGGSTGSISLSSLSPSDRRKLEKERRKQRKALEKQLGLGTRWYTVAMAVLLVIIAWFVIGVLMGTQLRRQEAQARDDIRAAVVAEQSTATAEVESENATGTAVQAAILASTATTTPTLTPTLTPTPTVAVTNTPTPTKTATPSPTPIGASQGRIAFVSNQDGDTDIYLYNFASDGITQLTFNTVLDGAPGWSPDGSLLAYQNGQANQGQHIWRIAPDGTEWEQLTEGTRFDSTPVWSPEGDRVAFHSSDNGRSYIRTVTVDGDQEDLVQVPVGPNLLWDWSPDGLRITYFGFSPAGTQEILRLDIDTDARTPITRSNGGVTFLSYSADRAKVLFTSFVTATEQQIFIADNNPNCSIITDCNTYQVTDDEWSYYTPRFSPDGTLILAASDELGNRDLVLINLEGNLVERITDLPADETDAVWQPTGE